VWGQKSLSPRGEDALKALAGLTRLGPDSRILHIGAELGGVAALLARGLGCKVVPVETLAALANASSGSVSLVRPGDPVLMPDADLILVDNLAERSDPLAAILRNQVSGLKPGGAVVLRSLVLSEPRAAVSARYREWAAGEPIRPRLRSAEDLTRLLHEARLSVQSSTSIADTYAADVEEHWRAALDRIRALHEDASGRALAPAVLGECERWLKRIELLREGVIGFRRFIAYRRELRR
jgi:cyclopropane fatty-acyl-phospholipid synthase-like methyltransferase